MTRSGLTLVEVLVSLALAALLAAAAQALVVNAYRVSREIENGAVEAARNDLPIGCLRQDLAAAATNGDIAIRGESLLFSTLNSFDPDCRSVRHFVEVRYWTVAGNLRRSEREPGQDWPEGAILARDVEQVTLSVFDGRGWHSPWPPTNYRPALALRIRLARKHAPDIDVTVPLVPLAWRAHR